MRRTDQRRAAVFACYQSLVTGTPVATVLDRGIAPPDSEAPSARPASPATEFTRELATGVTTRCEQLDGLISAHAIGWDVERIAPLERCIMRVALYEVLHRPDVPDEVAIDEAVESAKRYCGTEAPAFVNGILGAVIRSDVR